jgi:hypothetical protein
MAKVFSKMDVQFFFGATGVWTQGFTLARQALNHLSHTTPHLVGQFYIPNSSVWEFSGLLYSWKTLNGQFKNV